MFSHKSLVPFSDRHGAGSRRTEGVDVILTRKRRSTEIKLVQSSPALPQGKRRSIVLELGQNQTSR